MTTNAEKHAVVRAARTEREIRACSPVMRRLRADWTGQQSARRVLSRTDEAGHAPLHAMRETDIVAAVGIGVVEVPSSKKPRFSATLWRNLW